MERNDKSFYEAPSVQVIETRIENIICQSQNTMQNRTNYITDDDNPFV
ncbi:MAG: hypothetical protein K6A64_08895 [Bacteroidales bacterium]|nr:hypothetical protein [Bacteroidales bacterium]